MTTSVATGPAEHSERILAALDISIPPRQSSFAPSSTSYQSGYPDSPNSPYPNYAPPSPYPQQPGYPQPGNPQQPPGYRPY